MTAAMQPEPRPAEDARFGNGVPSRLRPEGLSFIEMTGVTHGVWVRDAGVKPDTFAGPEDTHPAAMPAPAPTSGAAAAMFQDLLETLTGEKSADGLATFAEAEIDDAHVAEGVPTEPSAPIRRPAQAVSALSEAETLMQALSRAPEPPRPPSPADDRAVALVREAFEAPASVLAQSSIPTATEETASTPTEEAEAARWLPPLEDFAPRPIPSVATDLAHIDANSPTPIYIEPASQAEQQASPAHGMPAREVFRPGAVAPGYTLLGHGPITWPGVPPQTRRYGAASGVMLLFAACALAAAAGLYTNAVPSILSVLPLDTALPAALVAAGAFGALALVFALSKFAGRSAILHDLSGISRALGAEVIGAIPLARGLKPPVTVDNAPLWAGLTLLHRPEPNDAISEAFDTLLTNFRFSAPRENTTSVCFVSVVPGDGLKTIAFNFAAAHAQRGAHVLFTTGDRNANPDLAVRERIDVPNLYCTDANVSGDGYDLAVRVGHSLLANPEARHAAARATAVVLVIDPAITSREMAQRALALLRDAKAPLTGIVVNRVRSTPLRRAYQRRSRARG